MEKNVESILDRFHDLMQEKKWSWGKAATVLGVNKGLLWNIIHRKKKPPDKVLGRMLIAWEFDE